MTSIKLWFYRAAGTDANLERVTTERALRAHFGLAAEGGEVDLDMEVNNADMLVELGLRRLDGRLLTYEEAVADAIRLHYAQLANGYEPRKTEIFEAFVEPHRAGVGDVRPGTYSLDEGRAVVGITGDCLEIRVVARTILTARLLYEFVLNGEIAPELAD